MLAQFGLPRLLIAGFLLLPLIMTPFVGVDLPTQITNQRKSNGIEFCNKS